MSRHRPLLGVTVSFALGILLGRCLSFSFILLFILCALALIASLLTFRNKKIGLVCLSILLILLGMTFFKGYRYLPKDHIYHVAKYYYRKPARIEGIVSSDIQKKKIFQSPKTIFTLHVRKLKTPWGWRKKEGKILVNIFREIHLEYGDHVICEGKMHRPFDFSSDTAFSYRQYLRRKGIYLVLSIKKSGFLAVKDSNKGFSPKYLSLKGRGRLKNIFKRYLSKNESGLMQAIILGDRSQIPKRIKELFVQTGTAHILAISGLHVGIVGFLIFVAVKFFPISRKGHYLLTAFFLISYAFLTGGRPSVVRATVMAVVFISGFIMERETDVINSLSLAALIILLMNPFYLFDVGFQLSFLSVLCIVSFSPLLFCIFSRFPISLSNRAEEFVIHSFSVSLSVWFGVAGLIAYTFHIVTPITIFANFIIIPFIAVIVTLGLGLLTAAAIWAPLGTVFALCLKVALNIMIGCVYLLGKIPYAYIYLKSVTLWQVVSYYVFIGGLWFILTRLTRADKYDTVNFIK